MGYFNIKLDDIYTEKFKELKTLLKSKNNDELIEKLIDIAQNYLQQQFFASPNKTITNSSAKNNSIKTRQQKP